MRGAVLGSKCGAGTSACAAGNDFRLLTNEFLTFEFFEFVLCSACCLRPGGAFFDQTVTCCLAWFSVPGVGSFAMRCSCFFFSSWVLGALVSESTDQGAFVGWLVGRAKVLARYG